MRGEIISIDGKALCGSYDTALGQPALSIVRAWAGESRLILGAETIERSIIYQALQPTHRRWRPPCDDTGRQKTVCTMSWISPLAKTREDKSRVRRDHGSKNLASIRDIAANLHRRPPKAWGAIKARMKQAGWNEDYLLQLLV